MIEASPVSKAVPLCCLIVTFALSLALFLIRNQNYVDSLPGFVDAHRNVASVLVQVLSTLLSIAQMTVICALINFAARIKLLRPDTRTSMGHLSFWSALSIPRFDPSLPHIKLILVTLLLTLGPGLGALWSGTLTPLSSKTSRNDGHILVPVFNAPIRRTMYPRPGDGAIITQCEPEPPDPRGSQYPAIGTCIVAVKIGSLMMTASTATNVTSPRQHPKIDNSTWTYRGRSYGKGSSTGLFYVNGTADKTADQGFTYEEAGYMASASCAKKASPLLPFQQYYEAQGGTQFNLSSADTVILESGNVSIPPFDIAVAIYNGFNSQPFGHFAWAAITDNKTSTNYLATTSSDWSIGLNDILCTIDFTPMTFSTNVSRADHVITVTPLEKITKFNQTGNIPEAIMWDLDLMSRMSSSSQGYTSLFTALSTNWGTVQLLHPDLNDNQTAELAMEDAIVEIIDDLLTYQGILAVARADGESVAQPVQRHFAAIQIGSPNFHIAQLAINTVLCLIYLFEVARTRYWKHLPAFDFVDIKELAFAVLGPHPRDGARRNDSDNVEVMAYYEGKSTVRIRYVDPPEEDDNPLGDDGIDLTRHGDESSQHSQYNPEQLQARDFISRPQNTHSTSYHSLRPLLGDS